MAAPADSDLWEAQADMEAPVNMEAQAVSVAAAVVSPVVAMEAMTLMAPQAITLGHSRLLEAALVAVAHMALLAGSVALADSADQVDYPGSVH